LGKIPTTLLRRFTLLVEAFERVVRPDLAPVSRGNAQNANTSPRAAHRLGGFGEPVGEGVGDFVPAGLDLAGVPSAKIDRNAAATISVGFGTVANRLRA
jgi:hypothetical protein